MTQYFFLFRIMTERLIYSLFLHAVSVCLSVCQSPVFMLTVVLQFLDAIRKVCDADVTHALRKYCL